MSSYANTTYTTGTCTQKIKKPIVLREPYTLLVDEHGKRCAVFQNFKNKMWYMVSNREDWNGGMYGNKLSPEERAQAPMNFNYIGCFNTSDTKKVLRWLEHGGASNYDIEEANQ